MRVCPISLVLHCAGCPFVSICPVKKLLGDFDSYPLLRDSREMGVIRVKCP